MDRAFITNKITKNETVKKTAAGVYSLLLGLCEFKGGCYPFSLCFLVGSDKYMFQVFLGCFSSALITDIKSPVGALLAMLVFATKWVLSHRGKPVSVWVKLGMSLGISAINALMLVLENSLILENIGRSVFILGCIPVFAMSFAVFSKKETEKRRTLLFSALLICVYITVKAAGVLNIGLFRADLLVASVITLCFAKDGFTAGGLCGFVTGMACGVGYMPVLGILGLCTGIFEGMNRVFRLSFSYVLACSVGSYLMGIEEAAFGIGNLLIGLAVFVLFCRNVLPPLSISGASENTCGTVCNQLGAAFSSLSSVFFTVSEECVAAEADNVVEDVQKAVSGLCGSCRGCSYDKYDLINSVSGRARKGLQVKNEHLPAHILASCKQPQQLIDTVNRAAEIKKNGKKAAIQSMAEEYMAFARLLDTADKQSNEDNYTHQQRNRRVKELFTSKGIACRTAAVYGKRKLRVAVYGIEPDKIPVSPKEISFMLSTLLMKKMSVPEIVAANGGFDMRLCSVPEFRVECAKVMSTKDGEKVCGDTVSYFENQSGYFYALISDGMGSGRDAELTSRLSAVFMEKLLSVGAEASEVLSMLNRLLIAKDEEIFTTVDLLEIDRTSGDARLIKAGAAPTFLYRGDECYRLEAKTPPVGIIDELKAAQTRMKLKKGDFIIMLSDGIAPDEARPLLPSRKETGGRYTAGCLAGKIMESWSKNIASSDDMSVCVIRIY